MRCIVLQDADGAHLGFMLCSRDLVETSGDCVFVALPARPELVHTPGAEALFDRRNAGESAWHVQGREPLSMIVRTPDSAADLFIEFGGPGPGPGRWGVGFGDD